MICVLSFEACRFSVMQLTVRNVRITNDAREDEMEENLVAVNSMVGNLKSMAIDMNSEITAQNKQLDKINVQVLHISLSSIIIIFISSY